MKKKTEGKNMLELVDPVIFTGVAEVLTYGANIYGANEWKKEKNAKDIYYAAMLRHIFKWRAGEKHDKSSGIHHLKCAGCNLMFLLFFEKNGKKSSPS